MAELDRIEQTVRSRLRTIRLSQGRSLDDVAGRAGLSPSTLSRIETGKRTISLDVLVPLRHVAWGANMNNSSVCAYGYGTSFTAPCIFQAMDNLGIAQYLTRVGLLLGDVESLDEAKRAWMAEHSLYKADDEHSSCGVGLVVAIDGTPSRGVVDAGSATATDSSLQGTIDRSLDDSTDEDRS